MTLRFVHFSDIHFGQERGDGGWDAYPDVRAEAISDILRMRAEGVVAGPADAVLVTGDIAQAGAEAEFKVASDWLDKAIAAAGCPPRAMRSVPGNHDVNLSRMTAAGLQTHNLLRNASVDDAYAFLGSLSGQSSNPIADKFLDYRGFAHAYGSDFTSDSNPVSIAKYPMLGGAGLRFIGFSTALISDRKDAKGKLILGANQYQLSREAGYEDIVMMHHPLDWLADKTRAEPYLNSRAKVVLTGHEHYASAGKIVHAHGYEQLRVAAGALTPPGAQDGYWYSYNWLEFDWVEAQEGHPMLQVSVYPRAWLPEHTRFGTDRGRVAEGQSHNKIVLKCDAPVPVQYVGAPVIPLKPLAAETQAEVVEPLNLPETDSVPEDVADAESFTTLRFLFWRYLDRDARIDALIQVGLLTEHARRRLPSFMEQEAFDDAGEDNATMAALWNFTMPRIPEDQRLPNPFEAKS